MKSKHHNKTEKKEDFDIKASTVSFTTENKSDESAESTIQSEESQDAAYLDLKAEIDRLNIGLIEEKDKRLRLLAEYDNYRRRTQSEISQILSRANERLITSLLPVLDDFDRFFAQKLKEVNQEALVTGIELIYRKLISIFEQEGLEPVKTEGEMFNSEIHDAIAEVEDNTKPAGTIITVAEKGYRLNGSIIRHPKVILSRHSNPDEGEKLHE